MEFQQLKGFLAVARNGSFSKAAQKTFRTQPAISLQVQSLEEEMGVKLIDRMGKKKVVLTDDGKILHDLVSTLVDDFDDLKSRFNELRGDDQRGTLRIATHTSVMVYLLPVVIKAFRKKYPEWNLSVVNRSAEEIVKMVMIGEADIGITSVKTVPASMNYEVFAKFKRLLIVPQGHPLSKKRKITIKDISEYPLLLPPKGTNTRKVVDDAFKKEGIEYQLAMEATGRIAAKAYIEMGLGISILNEFYIQSEDHKKTVAIDVSAVFGIAERGILTKKSRLQPNAIKEFISQLRLSK